jgi:GTP-binding protein EngB required for normal cell division
MLAQNHKSGMRTIFQTIDVSLARTLNLLDSSQSRSPFNEAVPDATPVQRKVVADYINRVRAVMRDTLESQGEPLIGHNVSSVWAARMANLSAIIALDNLHPKRLRGYGNISPEDAQLLMRVLTQVNQLLQNIDTYLAQGSEADLHERLARLADTDEHELLRKLEKIITRRGLVEFRGTLKTLLDRIESTGLEVAVFGRVSSGKSSLLNYIVESEVLPVGVTPVTAVVTRIHYGPKPQAVIEFAEGHPYVTSPNEIAQFACEQLNPGNAKHVTRIEVELPSRRLEQGITLVDTPGVGSLALSGAAESMAYLPRCDLGIVLVDAASTLVSQDVALVDLLHRAGASVQVLLSKADMLTEADRRQAVAYVRQQLHIQTEMDVPTFAVSVRGEHAALCHQWLTKSQLPTLERHAEMVHESIRRKTGVLRHAVATSLRNALNRAGDLRMEHEWWAAETALVEAAAQLEATLRQFDDSVTTTTAVTERVLDKSAARLSELWARDGSGAPSVGHELVHVLNEEAGEMAAERVRVVRGAQAALVKALKHAADLLGSEATEGGLIQVSDVPLTDCDETRLNVPLKRSWRQICGVKSLVGDVRNQLAATARKEIEQVLYRYGKTLNAWCRKTHHELHRAFNTRADFYRATASSGADQSEWTPNDIAADLADLESDTDASAEPRAIAAAPASLSNG